MTSLFPEGVPFGFVQKASQGVLAKFCGRCGAHLDAHGTTWALGFGSVRVCPKAELPNVARSSQPRSEEAKEGSEEAHPSADPLEASPRLLPLSTPFGTDNNAQLEVPRGGRTVLSQTHASNICGASCACKEEMKPSHVPCRSAHPSSLIGGALLCTEGPPKRHQVPCQLTNLSHLRGGAVNTAASGKLPIAASREEYSRASSTLASST